MADHRNCMGLVGIAGRGAAPVFEAVAAHPRIAGVAEPYQSRRGDGYDVTDLQRLAGDFVEPFEPCPTVAVMETTARPENPRLLMALLEEARLKGVLTSLVLVLRCPFAAFLSHRIGAAGAAGEGAPAASAEAAFEGFAREVREGLTAVCRTARAHHVRVVSDEGFRAAPADELARIMAVVPEPCQPVQFPVIASDGGTGDREGAPGPGAAMPDAARVRTLEARLAHLPEARLLASLRDEVAARAGKASDRALLDALTLLVL